MGLGSSKCVYDGVTVLFAKAVPRYLLYTVLQYRYYSKAVTSKAYGERVLVLSCETNNVQPYSESVGAFSPRCNSFRAGCTL